jgi:DNA-binding NarL/FixJ family response regulator
MCRAIRILCAAAGPSRLDELKRAAVSAHWELVGGATSLEQLSDHAADWEPDVIVLEAGLGAEAVLLARRLRPVARVVVVGAAEPLQGCDETVEFLEDIRPAIMGLRRPGGPVGVRPPEPPRTQ